ncbi:hypothetical protein L2E82_45350 [Cichorium intybus]|uniref:Uncharacterized protein n=1 Tax=Cichorium intybus TaxID=13427 RepID=A0ACB8ZSB5_CICIN|nr:hypothetical protein L2E82_45350 [Cichorium intybus]
MPAVDGGSFWPVQSPPVVSQFHSIEVVLSGLRALFLWHHFLIFDESASAFWSFLNLSLDFNYIGIYQFSTVKAHWDEKLEEMKEFEEESEKLMKLHEREEG